MTLAGLACAGALALSWNNLRAQSASAVPATSAPAVPAAAQNQTAPTPPPATPPRPRGRPGAIYQRTLFSLQQTKSELQKATNDFDGHRTLALDACEKAISELEAVMKSAGIPPIQSMQRPPQRAQPLPPPTAAPAPAAPAPPSGLTPPNQQ